ncbi:caspase family protein [Falsiroseomonas sp. HW251]|uniref:caspase family protein n=1 Tax=Falsiroseomonas sp. HW251 TaxID=3390998 RepID=UPI003D32160C
MRAVLTRRAALCGTVATLVGAHVTGAQDLSRAVVSSSGAADTAVRRWFLGIGNGEYGDQRLDKLPKSPVDAQDMGAAFGDLRFNVDIQTDLKGHDFTSAVIDLSDRVRQDDVVVFYFSGHGFQHDNDDYLVPVDSRFDNAARLERDNVMVRWIMETIGAKQPATVLMVLDACRATAIISRNGDTKGSSQQRGLYGTNAPPATLIAYATKRGDVAWTGNSNLRNSIYTHHLLRAIPAADTEIGDLFRIVRADVLDDTGQVQQPWESTSLLGAVYLNPGAKAIALEEAVWGSLVQAPSRSSVLKFIRNWPGGKHVPDARAWLAQNAAVPGPAVNSGALAEATRVIELEGALSRSRIQDIVSGQEASVAAFQRGGVNPRTPASVRILEALPNQLTSVFADMDRRSPVVAEVAPVTPLDVTGLPQAGTTGWARVRLPDGRNGFVEGVRVTERSRTNVASTTVRFPREGIEVPVEGVVLVRPLLEQTRRSPSQQVRIVAPPAPGGNLRVERQLAFARALSLQKLALDAGMPQTRIQVDLPEEPGSASEITLSIEEITRR